MSDLSVFLHVYHEQLKTAALAGAVGSWAFCAWIWRRQQRKTESDWLRSCLDDAHEHLHHQKETQYTAGYNGGYLTGNAHAWNAAHEQGVQEGIEIGYQRRIEDEKRAHAERKRRNRARKRVKNLQAIAAQSAAVIMESRDEEYPHPGNDEGQPVGV